MKHDFYAEADDYLQISKQMLEAVLEQGTRNYRSVALDVVIREMIRARAAMMAAEMVEKKGGKKVK